MIIRDETPDDIPAIRALVASAFADAPHSDGTEAAIVDALRKAGALSLSLVAGTDREIFGHVAFSPVLVDGRDVGWYGLGPLAVLSSMRRRGIGAALVGGGLSRLRARGAKGCVVLGDPAYYDRFGFANDPDLRFAGAPAVYFQRLVLDGAPPRGAVGYHPAFAAS